MELRQLKYFATLASVLSFSEASRKLFITQATLSQQIRQLEEELGHRLFERTSRKVRLTGEGEALLPLVNKTLQLSQQCTQLAFSMKAELVGTLKVGVTYCFDDCVISTIKEFYRLHPKVKLVIFRQTASVLMQMLRKRELDLVLAFKPTEGLPSFQMIPLFTVQPRAIFRADHPLAVKPGVSVDDIRKYGLILPGESQNERRSFDEFIRVDTTDLDVRMEIDDPSMLVDAVLATGLVGILAPVGSGSIKYLYRQPSILKSIPIDGLDAPMTCCVQRLKSEIRKPLEEEFIRVLQEELSFAGL